MNTSGKLILLRHGQSEWNKRNLFTGWVDVPLSTQGIQEALQAGKQLATIPIHLVFVSTLIRAQMTAFLALSEHLSGKAPYLLPEENHPLSSYFRIYNPAVEKEGIPVIPAWELNERRYGELQGLNKQETIEKYGPEQVTLWRRSFTTPPPGGESLAMTAERTIPYLEQAIFPHIYEEKTVLVTAHGNSLRAVIMYLEKLSQEEIMQVELATGAPLIYHYENTQWKRSL
eukprot:Opistho-1_new@9437